ncbi:hypothetical protein [Novipirellula artificiosorum]|uniref:Uncharacterized protein n=1 Tax=Novipirellula artificiosorum TaxID=2528016 RepID=A0A5C6DRA8_9BACT|nr:hypothetical protein [Novipirellula artificiosorum]TWU37289.1 hypothetical protein Poly41_34180 [Novipirellula artificiosorum]
MKIRSTHKRFGSIAARTFAACGLLAGTLVVSNVHAQTGLFGNFQSPSKTSPSQTAPKSIMHGDQEFHVMTADGVPTAASAGRVATVGSLPASEMTGGVAQTSCLSCGTSCGGACGGYSGMGDLYGAGSCGTGNCGNYGGYGDSYGGFGEGYGSVCGTPCKPYCYVSVEALYMEHQGDQPNLWNSGFEYPEFDFQWGSRITIGSVPDCVHGWEAAYVGPFDWNLASASTFASRDLVNISNALSLAAVPAAQNPFLDVVGHGSQYDVEYWSLEANKTLVGWDVAKILYGARYIDYSEEFNQSVVNGNGVQGFMKSTTGNSLVGGQIGLDMLYPVSCHGYMDLRGRAGAYMNIADADMIAVSFAAAPNNASGVLMNDDDIDLAGVFEIGTGYRYQLGEMLSVRAGVEAWYITGIASAPEQMVSVINAGPRQNVDTGESFFVLGYNFGVQVKY